MITEQAYTLLADDWHVDGDDGFSIVADALRRNDRALAVKRLDEQIEYATAFLRACITLRGALVMQDSAIIDAIREKDTSDIDDWPDRVEV